MRKYIGSFVLLLIFAAFTPFGQRLLLQQIPAWAIRDGGLADRIEGRVGGSIAEIVPVGDLTGYYFAPQPGQPTIFFAHGNSSRQIRQLRRLQPALDQGMGLYYVTYPGFDQNLTRQEPWGPQLFSEAGGRQAFRDHWQAYLNLGGVPKPNHFGG